MVFTMAAFDIQNNFIRQFPGNIYCKDLNGVIFWHNKNALENLKRKIGMDCLIGKTVYDFFDPTSAEKCYKDDVRIFHGSSDQMKIKQEKLSLINMEVQTYLTITKPIMTRGNKISGIIVNAINLEEMQQMLLINNNLNTITNLYSNFQHNPSNFNKAYLVLKEVLVVINIMQTIELNDDLSHLLVELKALVKKLLSYHKRI